MKYNGDYTIGSSKWNGLSKLIEESAEVIEVCGKLIGTGGETKHWEIPDLKIRLEEELGDLMASINFVIRKNNLDRSRFMRQVVDKTVKFHQWDRESQG